MSIGLREYARHRKAAGLPGGTLKAVQDAIESGRLSASLSEDGQIVSAELADREWAGTTREDRVPISGPAAASGARSDLQAHRTRREAALADLAEIEVRERTGKLIDVEQARADVMGKFTIVRNRLLGVPSRLRQRDSTMTTAQVAMVDDLIREALEELADADSSDEEDA